MNIKHDIKFFRWHNFVKFLYRFRLVDNFIILVCLKINCIKKSSKNCDLTSLMSICNYFQKCQNKPKSHFGIFENYFGLHIFHYLFWNAPLISHLKIYFFSICPSCRFKIWEKNSHNPHFSVFFFSLNSLENLSTGYLTRFDVGYFPLFLLSRDFLEPFVLFLSLVYNVLSSIFYNYM